jgi:hypothetical protein
VGEIGGFYLDASNVSHGFLRTRDGVITTFDVEGAGTGPGQGTLGGTTTPAGVIASWYIDSSKVAHSFLRIP